MTLNGTCPRNAFFLLEIYLQNVHQENVQMRRATNLRGLIGFDDERVASYGQE